MMVQLYHVVYALDNAHFFRDYALKLLNMVHLFPLEDLSA